MPLDASTKILQLIANPIRKSIIRSLEGAPMSFTGVYEDGTIAVKNEGKFWRLNPETLKIENPIDESMTGRDNLGPWFSY